MYDNYHSYTVAFLIAGLPPMVFGTLLSFTRFVRKRSMEPEEKDPNESKPLAPVSELPNKEGKHSTVIPSEHTLLLSKTNSPNYTR